MKKIIILRGNSGSGKTTLARALQMNCMEWIYMRTILIYHLKRRSGGIIEEIKNRNLVKKICVDGGEKRIFHQFLMKKLLHLILMQTVLLK